MRGCWVHLIESTCRQCLNCICLAVAWFGGRESDNFKLDLKCLELMVPCLTIFLLEFGCSLYKL